MEWNDRLGEIRKQLKYLEDTATDEEYNQISKIRQMVTGLEK